MDINNLAESFFFFYQLISVPHCRAEASPFCVPKTWSLDRAKFCSKSHLYHPCMIYIVGKFIRNIVTVSIINNHLLWTYTLLSQFTTGCPVPFSPSDRTRRMVCQPIQNITLCRVIFGEPPVAPHEFSDTKIHCGCTVLGSKEDTLV